MKPTEVLAEAELIRQELRTMLLAEIAPPSDNIVFSTWRIITNPDITNPNNCELVGFVKINDTLHELKCSFDRLDSEEQIKTSIQEMMEGFARKLVDMSALAQELLNSGLFNRNVKPKLS